MQLSTQGKIEAARAAVLREEAPQILRRRKQKRRAPLKGGVRQVVKTEIHLWYFCGQIRNRRSFHCGDFRFWNIETL